MFTALIPTSLLTLTLPQDSLQKIATRIPADVDGHLNDVFDALKALSSLFCYEEDIEKLSKEVDFFEYLLISQLLVLAWKSTVSVAELVTFLQKQMLSQGSWLCAQPSDTSIVPSCLQGYRLYCRIAEECIDMIKSGMRMHWQGKHSHESMLMLMNTKVDAEREALEDWLKTLHNDMSSTIYSVEKKLTLLAYSAEWE